jgi:uncharacterized protein
MRFPNARIVVFAKAPLVGKVKTRLRPYYGARGSATIHKQLIHSTLQCLRLANVAPVELSCFPDIRHPFFQSCKRKYSIPLIKQQGTELGQRMLNTFRSRAESNSGIASNQSVVLIGSDCVSLRQEDLICAFEKLTDGVSVVFAPAEDGGYTLIGARQALPALFQCMPWGSHQIANLTRSKLAKMKLDWYELPVQWDVDRKEDFKRFRRMLSKEK